MVVVLPCKTFLMLSIIHTIKDVIGRKIGGCEGII